eukprot:4054599-Amphidinium_carterae.2
MAAFEVLTDLIGVEEEDDDVEDDGEKDALEAAWLREHEELLEARFLLNHRAMRSIPRVLMCERNEIDICMNWQTSGVRIDMVQAMSNPKLLRDIYTSEVSTRRGTGVWTPQVCSLYEAYFEGLYHHARGEPVEARHQLTRLASSPFQDVMAVSLTWLLWYSDIAVSQLTTTEQFRNAVTKIVVPVATLVSLGGITPVLGADLYQATLDIICNAVHHGQEEAVFEVMPWRVERMRGETPRRQLVDLAQRLWYSAVGLFHIAGHGACRADAFAVTTSMLHIAEHDDVETYVQHGRRLVRLIAEQDRSLGSRFDLEWKRLTDLKRVGMLGMGTRPSLIDVHSATSAHA